MQRPTTYLQDILEKSRNNQPISQHEIGYLLSLNDSQSLQLLTSTASEVCRQHFGNRIFLYGFIYFSTYCRNQCAFCYYRRSNTNCPRYRKSQSEVLDTACALVDSGVHLVDLTMGEDPVLHETGDFQTLLEVIESVKKKTEIPMMVSPGVIPDSIIESMADLKVEWYALYQETHNRELFKRLRINQDFETRRKTRLSAKQCGMLVEDGILIGVGENLQDREDSILTMSQSNLNQARVMSFIPQPGTPLAHRETLPRINEMQCIATMRLAMPERLIPASLDVDGIDGLKMRLEAGANVVTSIIPPSYTLAGVAQHSLDVEEGRRTVNEVNKILAELNLVPASRYEYESWITETKKKTAIQNFNCRSC